jgi:hypothetical protein
MSVSQLGGRDDKLKETVQQYCTNAIADSTRKVYKTGFHTFIQFLLMSDIYSQSTTSTESSYPPVITVQTLTYFIGHCAKFLKLRHQTIKLYLAGVRYFYIFHDVICPLTTPGVDLSRLHLVLRGIKRTQDNVTVKRLPITVTILHQLVLASIKLFSPYISLLITTACTMAFYGFLRCGEFTIAPGRDNVLCIADICLSEQMFEVHLKASKTDVFRQGVTIKIFATGTSTCPVYFMRRFLGLRKRTGATAHEPLFLDEHANAMSRTYFISRMQLLLSSSGYISTDFNGHSLRIGAASTAGDRGLSDYTIQTLGRWSSNCYLRYVRLSSESIAHAQRRMSIT